MLVSKLPKEEIFNLTSQIKRAALSVSNNIAERVARKSAVERKRFYDVVAEDLVEQIFRLLLAMIVNTQ